MDFNPLTNDDVADILALLDSLPYDELDLETPRFRLTLRRTPAGWTQSTQVLSPPASAAPASAAPLDGDGRGAGRADEAGGIGEGDAGEGGDGGGDGDGEDDAGVVAVRAPLPGTFYRAPRPGAAPFVEVGSRVGADTVIGIVETMKLMNSVPAGVAGVVAEFCVANAEFAAQGAALLRIRADR
jgi:acetyl-CoA carboxylase biotin carboxyl carrier protein